MEGWRQLILGTPRTGSDWTQEGLLLFSLDRKRSIRQARRAVKARDELAALGLDGPPRLPSKSNYPVKRKQKKDNLAQPHQTA
jgi:hypothetical protein